jgi:hypothetical protein
MTTVVQQERLAAYLRQSLPQLAALEPTPPGYPETSWRLRSPDEIATDLIDDAEFRALGLGSWLGTAEGKAIANVVLAVLPPHYRLEAQLLFDALILASKLQQKLGRRTAGGIALISVAIIAGVMVQPRR